MESFDTSAACLQFLPPDELFKVLTVSKSVKAACERASGMVLRELLCSNQIRLEGETFLELWGCIWYLEESLLKRWPGLGPDARKLCTYCVANLDNKKSNSKISYSYSYSNNIDDNVPLISYLYKAIRSVEEPAQIAEEILTRLKLWHSRKITYRTPPLRKTMIGMKLGQFGWWGQALSFFESRNESVSTSRCPFQQQNLESQTELEFDLATMSISDENRPWTDIETEAAILKTHFSVMYEYSAVTVNNTNGVDIEGIIRLGTRAVKEAKSACSCHLNDNNNNSNDKNYYNESGMSDSNSTESNCKSISVQNQSANVIRENEYIVSSTFQSDSERYFFGLVSLGRAKTLLAQKIFITEWGREKEAARLYSEAKDHYEEASKINVITDPVMKGDLLAAEGEWFYCRATCQDPSLAFQAVTLMNKAVVSMQEKPGYEFSEEYVRLAKDFAKTLVFINSAIPSASIQGLTMTWVKEAVDAARNALGPHHPNTIYAEKIAQL